MDDREWLSERFEEHRGHLRAVAYRMLGSVSEADDAVQETWLRLNRSDAERIESLGAWLTTVVARVCLNFLRSRETRREESLAIRLPDPVVDPESGVDPEHEAILADAVGMALLVVLDTLNPVERVAFVLHDMFAVPFEDIADMLDRTPAATRQIASRARRRVHDQAPTPERDLQRQREVVDAFYAASRAGDVDALVAVLAPDVVLRADGGGHSNRPTIVVRGVRDVAGQAHQSHKLAKFARPALVNGGAGAVVVINGSLFAVMAFTVADGKIVAMDILYDPQRLADVDISAVTAEVDQ